MCLISLSGFDEVETHPRKLYVVCCHDYFQTFRNSVDAGSGGGLSELYRSTSGGNFDLLYSQEGSHTNVSRNAFLDMGPGYPLDAWRGGPEVGQRRGVLAEKPGRQRPNGCDILRFAVSTNPLGRTTTPLRSHICASPSHAPTFPNDLSTCRRPLPQSSIPPLVSTNFSL